MKSKVLLVYGYALKNSGDMAITEGAIDLLLSKGYTIRLIMRYNKSNWEYEESIRYLTERYKNEDIEFLESPFSLDRDKSFLNQIWDYVSGILTLLGIRKDRQTEELVKWADIIYFNGGNLLRCRNFIDYARLRALFYFVPLAIKNNKPYGILPNSCSTINRIGKKYLDYVIKHAKWVFIREEESFSFIKKLFPQYNDKIILTTDLAYFIKPGNVAQAVISEDDKTVAITLRAHGIGDIKELEAEEKQKICREMEKTIRELLENKYKVVIVVQTLKDKNISNEVYGKFAHEDSVNILFERNPDKLRSLYSKIDLLIGMRLHSIILATSMGTPCIGYFKKEWGLKNPGLMNAMGLPYFDADTDEIKYSAINSLLQDKGTYSALIKSHSEKLKTQLNTRMYTNGVPSA